jgi:parallel beta-helix repeat protein
VVIVGNDCLFNTDSGIFVEMCWNTYIEDNYVSMSLNGIYNNDSFYTHIFRNYVNNNSMYGIAVTVMSTNVTVEENNIEMNGVGVHVRYWSMPMQYVLIFHNRIVDNAVQATDDNFLLTAWDNGYPSGGNYWSDYYGNDTDGDGIGDTPYVISDDVADRYPLMAPWSPSEPPEPGVVCVSNGTSVTIFEQTGGVYSYTFSVSELMTTGGTFSTVAMLSETYTITSDGVFLTIECNRIPPYPVEGTGTGSNIVAVRLDGVPGFEGGLWATMIVNYTVGTGGIEDSRWNALGPADQIGPYGDSLCTYMGDYYSAIVLGFTVP